MPDLPDLPQPLVRLAHTRAADFGKRLLQRSIDDEVFDRAAGLAYRFLFALFPFAIFLAALAAYVAGWLGLGDPTNDIMGAVGDNLPPDIAAQITPQLQAVLGQTRPGLLTIGALAALWAAAGGIGALQASLNAAYDVPETRSFFVKNGVAVGLTLLGSAGILVAFVTIVGGSLLTQQAVRLLDIAPGTWETISLVRWPVMLVIVAIAVADLLRFAPNVAVPFRWPLVGGFVLAIGWVIATAVFAVYVANFANYSNTYGALGGVVVLMLWFYLTAVLLLLAAEVTALLAKDHAADWIDARQQKLAGPKPAAAVEAGGEAESPAPRLQPVPEVVMLERRPAPEPAPTGLLVVLLVLAGVIAGALVGLLSDRDEG